MRRTWLVPLLSVALVGSLLWGVGQYRARQQLETRLDLQYQQAFYALNWHMENLENETAKVLATNSKEQMLDFSGVIWREANSANDNLGQLPLRPGSMAKTGNFLTQLSAFSNFLADRKITTGQLTEQQWETMKNVHNKIKSINTELKKIQSQLGDNRTNWRDLEKALAKSTDQIPQNVLYQAFDGIERQMDRNRLMDFAEQFPDPMVTPRGITGPRISRAQAIEVAQNFLTPSQLKNKVVRSNGQGNGTVATYGVEVTGKGVGQREKIHLDITKKGGHVLWMINERPVGARVIPSEKAETLAAQFLAKRGYGSMALTSSTPYDGVNILSFVYKQDNVFIYPDMIKVTVALDNGEITGFDATNYLVFHHARKLPQPKLTSARARAKLNPHFKVEEEKLALILNEQRKEVLCYEFRGRIGSNQMVIFVNAVNGREEDVQRITPLSSNTLQAGASARPVSW